MRTACLRAASSATRLARCTRVAQLSRPVVAKCTQRVVVSYGQQFRAFQQAAAAAEDVFETPKQSSESAKPTEALDTFPRRHIGPSADSAEAMLKALDPPVSNLDEFVRQVIEQALPELTNIARNGDTGPTTPTRNNGYGGY